MFGDRADGESGVVGAAHEHEGFGDDRGLGAGDLDLDLVVAGGDGEVAGGALEGQRFNDEAAVGIDVNRGGVSRGVNDAEAGFVGTGLAVEGGGGEDDRGQSCGDAIHGCFLIESLSGPSQRCGSRPFASSDSGWRGRM